MKKTFLLAALLTGLILTAKAQTAAPVAKEDTVTIKLPASKLNALKQVLAFSYTWLPKSDAPAKDVTMALPVIQELYTSLEPKKPVVEPVKPSPKKKP